MIKKRYLVILSLAIVSVLLGSSFYNTITQAGKPTPQPEQVEVTNFPLDEEGNLRTTTVKPSKIMLVFNETVTVPSSTTQYTYLTSFNTSGFKYAFIMAKATGSFQVNAQIHIHVYDSNFGMQTQPYGVGDVRLDMGAETSKPNYGTGTLGKYEIHSMTTDVYLQVYNSDVGFSGLLTIAVSLTN